MVKVRFISTQVSVFHLQNFILTLKGIFLLFNIVLTPFLSGNHQLQMPCDTSSPEVDVSKKEHKMRTILGSEEGAGNSLFQHLTENVLFQHFVL